MITDLRHHTRKRHQMSQASEYITLQADGKFLARHGNRFTFTRSIFVAYAWVNQWLRAEGAEPLDVWEAQEIQWALIGGVA